MSGISYNNDQIRTLIADEIREHVKLDYKGARALTNTPHHKMEISKDISGFTNSAGGDIIYGIREDEHVPQEIDGLSDIITRKEWLEQVINSNIEPRIQGIVVYHLPIDEEKSVLIASIPMSHTAHQAKDHRYYHRYGSETLPMEDYQVRQTMNRTREPVLRIDSLQPEPISLPVETANSIHRLELFLTNIGIFTAKSCMVNVYLPNRLGPHNDRAWNQRPLEPKQIDGYRKCNILTVQRQPIMLHPGQQIQISGQNARSTLGLHLDFPTTDLFEEIPGYFEIYAENMTPKYGQILFKFARSFLSISTSILETLPYRA